MSPVYKSVTHSGNFVAFWQRKGKLWVFCPGLFRQKEVYEMEDWRSRCISYPAEELSKYEDVVNAAWHYCRQSLDSLDRDKTTRSAIEPGVYYPRIWRGYRTDNPFASYDAVNPSVVYGNAYTQSAIAMDSLLDYLNEILKYVEPVPANLGTFSHKIREALILVCTEIESGWRAVLDENTAPEKRKQRYTTSDYVKVKTPLNLGHWAVCLSAYPNLAEFTPFNMWNESQSTRSLPWYDSYNATKHHREAEFSKSSLLNLLNAMSALRIMSAAQWGPASYGTLGTIRPSTFTITRAPKILSEVYIPSIDGKETLISTMYFER